MRHKRENDLIWEGLRGPPGISPGSPKSTITTVKGTDQFVPALADITDPKEKKEFASYIKQGHDLIDKGEWTAKDLQNFANDESQDFNQRRAATQVLINIGNPHRNHK